MLFQYFATTLVALASVNAKSVWQWDFHGDFEESIYNVKFGFNFKTASPKKFWEVKQQVLFDSQGANDGLATVGLAPQENGHLRAFFTTDIEGAEPLHENCKKAQNGLITCEKVIVSALSSDHVIMLDRVVESNQYIISLVSEQTRYKVGQVSLPESYGEMKPSQYGSLEATERQLSCDIHDKIEVEVFQPESVGEIQEYKKGHLTSFRALPPCDATEHAQYTLLANGNVLISSI